MAWKLSNFKINDNKELVTVFTSSWIGQQISLTSPYNDTTFTVSSSITPTFDSTLEATADITFSVYVNNKICNQ